MLGDAIASKNTCMHIDHSDHADYSCLADQFTNVCQLSSQISPDVQACLEGRAVLAFGRRVWFLHLQPAQSPIN